MSRVEGKGPPTQTKKPVGSTMQRGFSRRELLTDFVIPTFSGFTLVAVGGWAGFRRLTDKKDSALTPHQPRPIDDIETSPLESRWRDDLTVAVSEIVVNGLQTDLTTEQLKNRVRFVGNQDYVANIRESYETAPEQDLPGWNPPLSVFLPDGTMVFNTDAISDFAQKYEGDTQLQGHTAEVVITRLLLMESMTLSVLKQKAYIFPGFSFSSGNSQLSNIDELKDFRFKAVGADGKRVFLHGLDTSIAGAIAEILSQQLEIGHMSLSDKSLSEAQMFKIIKDAAGITDEELKKLVVGDLAVEWLLERVQAATNNPEFLDEPDRNYDQALIALAGLAFFHEGLLPIEDVQNMLFGTTGVEIKRDD